MSLKKFGYNAKPLNRCKYNLDLKTLCKDCIFQFARKSFFMLHFFLAHLSFFYLAMSKIKAVINVMCFGRMYCK